MNSNRNSVPSNPEEQIDGKVQTVVVKKDIFLRMAKTEVLAEVDCENISENESEEHALSP